MRVRFHVECDGGTVLADVSEVVSWAVLPGLAVGCTVIVRRARLVLAETGRATVLRWQEAYTGVVGTVEVMPERRTGPRPTAGALRLHMADAIDK